MGVLKENKPTADILMTSMRAMGYDAAEIEGKHH